MLSFGDVTGTDLWGFFVGLDNLRSVSGVTVTATDCVAEIDYTTKRLYVVGTEDALSISPTVTLSNNCAGHDLITLTITEPAP